MRIPHKRGPHHRGACIAQIADNISELKLGNGTSVLITANIASALPTSVGAALQQAADKDSSALPIYALAFFLTTLGVVYVQEVRAWLSLWHLCTTGACTAPALQWQERKTLIVGRHSCHCWAQVC